MGGDARLPKRIMFGNIEGVVRRGRDERGNCGPTAYRALFGRLKSRETGK